MTTDLTGLPYGTAVTVSFRRGSALRRTIYVLATRRGGSEIIYCDHFATELRPLIVETAKLTVHQVHA